MKNIPVILLGIIVVNISCTKNTITGRSQLSLVSEKELEQTAVKEYKSFLTKSKVVNTTVNKDAEMVTRVGTRIANAITTYYNSKGLTNELKDYK